MSSTGIVMRQALGTPPPATDAAWLFSPDILLYPVNPPSDPTLFTSLYGTPFSQPPAISAANHVYVRGRNAGTGPQVSTVYLFSADHNPNGGLFDPSLLLQPQQWQSTNFTVGGVAQNHVAIQANAPDEIVLGGNPLVWTPVATARPGTDHYCLIAWVDDTGHNPPPFASLADFTTLHQLRQYVEAHPNMTLLDTASIGMFVRGSAGQQFNQSPQSGISWSSSPDLVLYAGQPQFDPSLLTGAPGWTFHQMPLPTQSNFLYVRGINTTTGALTARVSFFIAQDDPTATTNPLLNPQNWESGNFTLGGVAQNHFDVSADSPFLPMSNATALIWTPPAPAAGAHDCVIAWIDVTDGSNPPPFSTMPAFTSIDAFSDFVRAQRNVIVWDTARSPLFARQFPGQTIYQPGTGAQTSPDLIVVGPVAVQDASSFATQSSYASTALNQTVTLGERNFVYVRVLNPQNRQQRARVYLYSALSASISPTGWSPSSFTVAGTPQNFIDLVADTANEILVSTVPAVWTAPPAAPAGQGQLILVAYVDGSADPQPPDFSQVAYTELSAVTLLMTTQPQLVWLSLTANPPNPAPSMSFETPLATTAAVTQLVGLQFQNIPQDGQVSVSIPGPDAANTIVKTTMAIPDPNAFVLWSVSYPANFQNSIVVNYWPGPTAPAGGNIEGKFFKA